MVHITVYIQHRVHEIVLTDIWQSNNWVIKSSEKSPFFTLDTNKVCIVFLLAVILCSTNKTNKSKTLWFALRLTPSMTWGEKKYDIN